MPQPIDMSGANVVDPGIYLAAVATVEEGVSKGAKTGGAFNFRVRFKLVDRPGSVFESFIVHEKTAWKLRNFLSAVGFDDDQIALAGQDAGDDDDPYPTLRQLMQDAIGIELAIEVGVRPAEGQYKARNEINGFRPAGQVMASAGSWR